MKKLFYSLMFFLLISFMITSCTEDNVKPKDNLSGGGSGSIDPVIK